MQPAILNFLERDVFKNIVLLKMLHAYGDYMEQHFMQTAEGTGLLLLLPTQVSYYDATTYPQTKYVVLFSTDNLEATQTLFDHIPTDCNLIFKLMDEAVKGKLASIFPLQRVTSFLSYTSRPESCFVPDPEVHITHTVDEASLTMYESQGHPRATVQRQFADGEAIHFSFYQQEKPVSLCFTYRNYDKVWEIGGVWSDPAQRRKGYARRVVATALHTLTQKQRTPRYQVHETNRASIQLAESLGLIRFVEIEHFLAKTKVLTE
ncbi:MAG: GNAT family N-acetyltransferase [Caldilineaceae bacterium]